LDSIFYLKKIVTKLGRFSVCCLKLEIILLVFKIQKYRTNEMLSQIKAKCHQEISKLNKNGSETNTDEHFNYKNYIMQQKDLLSKIYQQQKKLKKFSNTRNNRPVSNATNFNNAPIAFTNENKKSLVDSSYPANLILNSLQIEHLKKSSNSLKPYSPNFSKKKILILNQLVFDLF
jgi:hypothetical protein